MRHFNLESFGVLLEIEVQDDSLEPLVEAILPPGWTPSDAFPEDGHLTLTGEQAGDYSLIVDGQQIASGFDEAVAMHLLDAELRMRVARFARDRIFVHAGVVAFGDRAVLLPGQTFIGKSTLVAALIGVGATYYSDEYAVLDSDGMVHPYPRDLSLRRTTANRYGDYTPVEELGGVAGSEPVRPAVIAVIEYTPGERWQPERRNAGFGALALLKNAVPANEDPTRSLHAVTRATADAIVLEGPRGEAGEAAAGLFELVGEIS